MRESLQQLLVRVGVEVSRKAIIVSLLLCHHVQGVLQCLWSVRNWLVFRLLATSASSHPYLQFFVVLNADGFSGCVHTLVTQPQLGLSQPLHLPGLLLHWIGSCRKSKFEYYTIVRLGRQDLPSDTGVEDLCAAVRAVRQG